MANKKLHEAARKLHTHTVVYRRDSVEMEAASLAMAGWSTKAIAKRLGISPSMAQYRISKAQGVVGQRFRDDYRSGNSPIALIAWRAIREDASDIITHDVATKFLPLSKSRINQ